MPTSQFDVSTPCISDVLALGTLGALGADALREEVPLFTAEGLFRLWDSLIRGRVTRGLLEEHEIPDRALCRLGNSFHAASPAVKTGIRVFLRARPITTESSDHMGPWYPQSNVFLPLMGGQTNAAAPLAAPYFPRKTFDF